MPFRFNSRRNASTSQKVWRCSLFSFLIFGRLGDTQKEKDYYATEQFPEHFSSFLHWMSNMDRAAYDPHAPIESAARSMLRAFIRNAAGGRNGIEHKISLLINNKKINQKKTAIIQSTVLWFTT